MPFKLCASDIYGLQKIEKGKGVGGGRDDDGPDGVRSPLIVVWNDFGNEPSDDGDALLRRFWALPYKHKLSFTRSAVQVKAPGAFQVPDAITDGVMCLAFIAHGLHPGIDLAKWVNERCCM